MKRGIREERCSVIRTTAALREAATLLEGCRGYFAYQSAQGDQFAPDANWEKPIIEWLEAYKAGRFDHA